MLHWCQGKAEALTSHLFPATVGLEHVQKWSLLYFFFIYESIAGPTRAQVGCKTAHSSVFYLTANTRLFSLNCYPGCSEKWEFWGHNSSHAKAAVQNRLSETPLELGDRDDTWPRG